MGDKVDVNLTVNEEHKNWARENHVNLSSFLRSKIDEEMQS